MLEDAAGNEVATIQEHKLRVRDTMQWSGELSAHGNIVDHEYEIERDGDTIATVSSKWFRVRDTYGVEVAPGEDEALMLALTVAIDRMADR